MNEKDFERIRGEWETCSNLDERQRRLWAAEKASTFGSGGITLVSRATGLTRDTIRKARVEIKSGTIIIRGRVRAPGGGRKKLTEADPELIAALETLIDQGMGIPNPPLRWTCRSATSLAVDLSRQYRPMRDGKKRKRRLDARTVASLLREAGYDLRSNRRRIEGAEFRNRDAQFRRINEDVSDFLQRRQPVVSVDTGIRVAANDWRSADMVGSKLRYLDRGDVDFSDPKLKALFRGGVDDATDIRRWSSVGITLDIARFAVASIEQWWTRMGREQFPRAKRLLIIADCGGRNDERTREWKAALKGFADGGNLGLAVCHLPRGTIKWRSIQQQLLGFPAKSRRDTLPAKAIISVIGRAEGTVGTIASVIPDVDHRPDSGNAEASHAAATFDDVWNWTYTRLIYRPT